MIRKALIPGSFALLLALAGGSAGFAQSSIEVTPGGNVGVGTATPTTKLHVFGTDSGVTSTKLLVENATSGAAVQRELFELRNKGGASFIIEDTTVPERWSFASFSNSFIVNNQANGGVEYTFGPTGTLVIAGNLIANGVIYPSSRVLKDDFQKVDGRDVLARLAEMPVTEWRYKSDVAASRHIGPMAEDFRSTFKLGAEGAGLNVGDVAGVTIAAVQGLWLELRDQKTAAEEQHKVLTELQQVVQEQRQLIDELRAQLAAEQREN
jgi:hypothetical protein